MEKKTMMIRYENMTMELDDDLPYRIGYALHFYGLPCVLVLGLVGNLLSFCVMMQAPNRHIPCSCYFAALSVSDNIVMMATTCFWFHNINNEVSVHTCRTYAYFVNVGSSCSCYIIVLITLERYWAICRILKKGHKLTSKTALLSVMAVFIMTIIINVPVYFNSMLIDENVICASYTNDSLLASIWVWLSTALFFLIPFCLVSWLNIKIYLQVRRRWSLLIRRPDPPPEGPTLKRALSTSSMCTVTQGLQQVIILRTSFNKKQFQQQAERKLTKMMVAISLAFICLSLPQYTRYITYVFLDYRSNFSVFCLVFHITNKLFISNNAINFFLYCLAGEKFRKDFVDMVKKAKKQLVCARDALKQQASSCGKSHRPCCQHDTEDS